MECRNENPKLNGENYDNWKDKIKNHLVCTRIDYQIIEKPKKTLAEEKDISTYTTKEKVMFIYNMYSREALIFVLQKLEFFEVKVLHLTYVIWTRLEALYEGDNNAKKSRF